MYIYLLFISYLMYNRVINNIYLLSDTHIYKINTYTEWEILFMDLPVLDNVIFTNSELKELFDNYILQSDKYTTFINNFIISTFNKEQYSLAELIEIFNSINNNNDFQNSLNNFNDSSLNSSLVLTNNSEITNGTYIKLQYLPYFFNYVFICFLMDLYYLGYIDSKIKSKEEIHIQPKNKNRYENNLYNKITTYIKNNNIIELYKFNTEMYYRNSNIVWQYFFTKLYPYSKDCFKNNNLNKFLDKYYNIDTRPQILTSRLLFTKLCIMAYIQNLNSVNICAKKFLYVKHFTKSTIEDFFNNTEIQASSSSNKFFIPNINNIMAILHLKLDNYEYSDHKKDIFNEYIEVQAQTILFNQIFPFYNITSDDNEGNSNEDYSAISLQSYNQTNDETAQQILSAALTKDFLNKRMTTDNLCTNCLFVHNKLKNNPNEIYDVNHCIALCNNQHKNILDDLKRKFDIGSINKRSQFYTFLVNQGYINDIIPLKSDKKKTSFFDVFNGYLKQKIIKNITYIIKITRITLARFIQKKDMQEKPYNLMEPQPAEVIDFIEKCIPSKFYIEESDNKALEDLPNINLEINNISSKTQSSDTTKSTQYMTEVYFFKICIVYLVLVFYDGQIECLEKVRDYEKCLRAFAFYNKT